VPPLRIADLVANPLVDPSAHLNPDQVKRYADDPESAPPVVVFETESGLLLADGYHRVAAAQQRGAETIDAELRKGSLKDALRYAAKVGARQRGISTDDALAAIKRHSQRYDGRRAS
jgi:ParB-like chromosome segregation protein Spo0J